MEQARFTDEYGKEIFILNFDLDCPEDAFSLIRECARQIRRRPLNSVLTLTKITRGKFTPELIERLQQLAKENEPYVRKAAVVGVNGPYEVAMAAVSIYSKRNFKLFDYPETAIAYLLQEN